MISFAAVESDGSDVKTEMVCMRVWRIITKRSGTKVPRVELEEVGPRIDFRLGRVQTADADMLKEAMRKDKTMKPKVKKNVDVDLMGDKVGRIHVGRQNLGDIQTRKMKGLKRTATEEEFMDLVDDEDEQAPRPKKKTRA